VGAKQNSLFPGTGCAVEVKRTVVTVLALQNILSASTQHIGGRYHQQGEGRSLEAVVMRQCGRQQRRQRRQRRCNERTPLII
jgi:hypothetical protein